MLTDVEQKNMTCFRQRTCSTLIDTFRACVRASLCRTEEKYDSEESKTGRFSMPCMLLLTCYSQNDDNVIDIFLSLLGRCRFDSCYY